jgi:hypothetical protein
MKMIISKQTARLLLSVTLTSLSLVAYCMERDIPALSNHEKETYENYARSVFPLLWTNDCSELRASLWRQETFQGCPWSENIVIDLYN